MIIKLKVFNSDIILGKFEKEINLQFVTKLAQSVFSLYKDQHLVFVVGKDTKPENYEIEKTLAKVLSALGANVFLLGTTSTGAVSFATRAYKATAGIMITGSSKPKGFVGFKIFNGNGYKITDEQIEALRYKFKNISELSVKNNEGKVYYKPYFNFEYINFLKQFSSIAPNQNAVKVLADLSCGSGEEIYEELMLALGVKTFLAFGGADCENVNISYQRAISFDKTNTFKTQDFFGNAKEHKSFFDFKVVLDADCDKLVIFNKDGKRIFNEKLLMLFALAHKQEFDKTKVVVGGFVNSKTLDFFEKHDIDYFVEEDSIKQKHLIHHAIKQQADLAGDSFGNIVFMNKSKTADAFLTLIEFLNIFVNKKQLYNEVMSFELNKKHLKKIKVNPNFDVEDFKKVLIECELSLLESGKILAFFNKYQEIVEVHIETDDDELKDKIFNHIQTYFSNKAK